MEKPKKGGLDSDKDDSLPGQPMSNLGRSKPADKAGYGSSKAQEVASEPDAVLVTEGPWMIDSTGKQWSVDHCKLLYLLSLFAKPALTVDDKEGWIRSIPMTVLIYEGIVASCIGYDYGPSSVLITQDGKSKRMFINVSQEGKSAVDDLREAKLINGLKLSSEDFQPVTAYQVSIAGLDFLEKFPKQLRESVEEFAYAPAPHQGEILQVKFDGEDFFLCTDSGYSRRSEITETEDVSYVSSPYLPVSLRKSDKPLSSNSHRANESAQGESNIRDELSEAIHLAQVHVLVGEWIPFGSNQIVALNERLGAMDRCQGGLFTALVDKNPTDTQFKVPAGLTQVTILDYDLIGCINFEAEINYPEDDGIVQIENFGMHLNVDGTILYGMRIDAILDRKSDDISLDLLCRLLVDVHQDSSKIINDLLSAYQRSLLDMLFIGDMENRGKYNMIIAESMDPFLRGEQYMDRGDLENEIKQVIGDVTAAHNIGSEDVLVIGRDGMLFAGPNSKHHEPLLLTFLSLLVREMFIRNFFIRTFVLDDHLKKIRALIIDHDQDPNNIPRVRGMLNDASRDIILLQEVLSYLNESLLDVRVPQRPLDEAGSCLHDVLGCENLKRDVTARVNDMMKLVEGASHELSNLSQMTDVINTKQLEDVFRNVESNTKYLVDASAANERASASLEVMQVILAGSFAFDIIDRISGGTLNVDPPWWVNEWIVEPVIAKVPFLWFGINMLWLFIFCAGLIRLMRYLAEKASGVLTLRVKVNCKIDVEALEKFLSTKKIDVTDSLSEPTLDIKKVTWQEDDPNLWQGPPPKIELQYDEKYGFLLNVLLQLDKRRSKLTEDMLLRVFYKELQSNNVLLENPDA